MLSIKKLLLDYILPIRFHRITRRREGGSGGVYFNTLRKPTSMPTKLAEEREMVLTKNPLRTFILRGPVI
jgi:hypothetical protein